MKFLTVFFLYNLSLALGDSDRLGTIVTSEHETKVKKELKGMGYKSYKIDKNYYIKPCPDGHLNFVIVFAGTQFSNKKRGYFCPPYINQSVIYEGEKL